MGGRCLGASGDMGVSHMHTHTCACMHMYTHMHMYTCIEIVNGHPSEMESSMYSMFIMFEEFPTHGWMYHLVGGWGA